MPSGTIQSGKVLQNKSQFRTIAPKIVPRVLTPRVLPCHSPSVSDQGAPGPSISSTPLEVLAQNYALMQVAGQEGTFSLIAFPRVTSAQPIQKPRLPLPENLKLPIPRYRPARNRKGSKKKTVLSSSESGCSKPLAQTQMSPSPPDHSEPPPSPSPPKPVLSLDQAPASVGMAALTSVGGHRDSPVTNDHGDPNLPDSPTSSTPEEPSAKPGLMKISGKENISRKQAPSKPVAVVSENHKEQVDLAKGTIKLSTALFGNGLQLIRSVPKGKLPILPYARVKMTEVYKSESDVNTVEFSSPGLRADCNKISSITGGLNTATRIANKVLGPQLSKRSPCDTAFYPAAKLDLNHKTKLNGATKRKGRKLKVPDEILAFQGKRKKCKRIKNNSQDSRDQKPGALKKYRSIMPKPVTIVPALAALPSPAAMLQSQRPSSLGQDVLLNNSLIPKHLGCKQDNSPSPKPSSAFRNGFSGIQKPWHRCPVCNHHFQFKQHLRDHMNTHTNRRPYSCRICRKAYVRSGSLSTHMKLHHGDNRLKKLVCCEFCAKVFGHVRVYFGHLKEVHRVVISTEPSPNEPQPGDTLKDKDRDVTVRGMEGSVHRENKSSLEEDLLLNQADEVKLQIKCGRCQITVQSFAEIKFHLLYVHGEEIQGRLQEAITPGSLAAQEELVKQASPSWKQHPERRKLLKHCPSEEKAHAFSKLKRQLNLHHQDDVEILPKSEGAQPKPSEPGPREPEGVPQGPACPGPQSAPLGSHSGFNCILCAQTLGRKEELLLHWEQQHNCEDPPKLWRVLSALSNRGEMELPSAAEK